MKNNKQFSPRLLIASSIEVRDNITISDEDKSTDFPQPVKELPLVFFGRGEVKGRQFTQIRCSCRAYLYKVESSGVIYWEVFHRRQNQRFGTASYHSSNAFGKWAWTFMSFNKVVERFEKLNLKGGN